MALSPEGKSEYTLFRYIVEQSGEEVYIIKPDLSILFANKIASESLGVTRDLLSGMNIADFDSYIALHRGGDDDIFKKLRREKTFTFDTLHESIEGNRTFKRIKAIYFIHNDNEFVCLYASDISGKMQSEVDILRREERFRNIFEQSADGIFIIATNGIIIEWNEKMEAVTGISKIDAVDKNISTLYASVMTGLTPEEKMSQMAKYETILKIVRKGILVQDSFEISLKSTTGSLFEVQHFVFPVTSIQDGGFLLGNIVRDITDRRRLEEERIRAQKLDSLGILAGGIAHDFRNILSAILGNITLAGMELQPASPQRKYLTSAETAVLRARELTSRLLTFSKGGEPVKQNCSINELIEESAALILSGSNITYTYNIDDALPDILADRVQMGQVIQNLIINAMQAMPEGGRIKLQTEVLSLNNGDILLLPAGKYAKISVSDTGYGIAKENLEKIFDPYFTTKEEGTGLGLSVVYSIVRRHGGNVTVESTPGSGTSFNIYLPMPQIHEEKLSNILARADAPLTGSGRILVIDDEDIVRNVIKNLLKSIGYEAETACTVEEGLNIYTERKTEGRPFNAVIMDLTIRGGVSGKKGIQLFKDKHPESKIIVASGYSNDPVLARFEEYGFFDALMKPIELKELSRIMKRAVC
jgi:two-component system, cell cycle sensor histidine kinase and response regulator CckA